ncbi:MAG: GNAT family N-acetyltransferase [Arenibacter sp.]|uniref:GNAT family N-acetyltransferase n=1 Tax=Arenibacter TaxID=178469 RepID=UPI000A3707BD|nr:MULTISPECIES: GNAT family N-acetyltransferase [Arenibacter]MDX1328479.1 GNAT family N-acetyltransferase [Arenibacter sp.]
MSLEILPFESGNSDHAHSFKILNEAWLTKHFYLEPKDQQLLANSEANIINKGGYIYFARLNGEIIGCFALLPHAFGEYELSKMAVDPTYQGMKIGQALLQHAVEVGKKNKWKKLMLYSNTRLKNAIHIYKKIGFKEVVLENDLPYDRCDIKMELALT